MFFGFAAPVIGRLTRIASAVTHGVCRLVFLPAFSVSIFSTTCASDPSETLLLQLILHYLTKQFPTCVTASVSDARAPFRATLLVQIGPRSGGDSFVEPPKRVARDRHMVEIAGSPQYFSWVGTPGPSCVPWKALESLEGILG